MSLRSPAQHSSAEIHLPADVDWEMLDKTKFFLSGAVLFSGVSMALYPVMVIKTRQQVAASAGAPSFSQACHILRHEGPLGLYRGFGTSLIGTIPARVVYMSALEITKSSVGSTAVQLGLSQGLAATASNALAGVSASVAAQLVWTPVDVVSQRLMVQSKKSSPNPSTTQYKGGLDAFRTILRNDGWRGLYRGFGMSILTYAPSNALWWASYCLAQKTAWSNLGYCCSLAGDCPAPSAGLVVGVQGASAACAGGVTALLTTPLDTIKTRFQVLAGVGNHHPTLLETAKSFIKEEGWMACYRGIGPRWVMMALSATTMITTYEFLKRLSKKKDQDEHEVY